MAQPALRYVKRILGRAGIGWTRNDGGGGLFVIESVTRAGVQQIRMAARCLLTFMRSWAGEARLFQRLVGRMGHP